MRNRIPVVVIAFVFVLAFIGGLYLWNSSGHKPEAPKDNLRSEFQMATEKSQQFKLGDLTIYVPAGFKAKNETHGTISLRDKKEESYQSVRVDNLKKVARTWIVNDTDQELKVSLVIEFTLGSNDNKPKREPKAKDELIGELKLTVRRVVDEVPIRAKSAMGYDLPDDQKTVWFEVREKK